jgi:hypothetical protein
MSAGTEAPERTPVHIYDDLMRIWGPHLRLNEAADSAVALGMTPEEAGKALEWRVRCEYDAIKRREGP